MNYLSFETERLILKATNEEDAPLILELLNTPEWIQYIGDRNVHSLEEAAAYIRKKMTPQLERLGYSNYTVIRMDDNAKLGFCGLYDREGLEGVDIGFAFLPKYHKQGYAFEAASRLLAAAYEHFHIHSVSAITSQENINSQKLLVKLGLQRVGLVTMPNEDEELFLYRMELVTP